MTIFGAFLFLPLLILCVSELASALSSDHLRLGRISLVSGYLVFYWSGSLAIFSAASPYDPAMDAMKASLAMILITFCFLASRYGYNIGYGIAPKSIVNVAELRIACLLATSLGMICIALYVSSYGGVTSAITYAAQVRAGVDRAEEGSVFTFTKYFMPIVTIPTLFYLYEAKQVRGGKSVLYLAALLITTVLALVLMSGRSRIVMFVICFMLVAFGIATGKRKNFIIMAVLSVMISAPVITSGKSFFSSLSSLETGAGFTYRESDKQVGLVDSVSQYFATRIESLIVAYEVAPTETPFRFFRDVIDAPLFIIPEKLTGIQLPESVSVENTYNITGIRDSMIPPGVVASGYYDLGVVGATLYALLLGGVLGSLDRRMTSRAAAFQALYVPTILWLTFYMFSGDMRVLLRGTFFIITFFFILALVAKWQRAKQA